MADNSRNSSPPAPLEGLNAWSEMEKDYLEDESSGWISARTSLGR